MSLVMRKPEFYICENKDADQLRGNREADQPLLVREPAIGLIMWLRPKGLKVYSYVEKYAEFKNQTLSKIGWYTNLLCAIEYPWG